MIHPHTEVRYAGPEVGYGVFATAFIPRGTITWVRDRLDREFTPEELTGFDDAHREVLDRYSYRNARGHYVFCWDHTRYMNHSFAPNCLPTAYGLEIAVEDIEAGEELTNDYGCLNIIEAFTPVDEGHARKQVRPDDLLHFSAEWDARIAAALPALPSVDQPLRRLLPDDHWLTIEATARGEQPLKSVALLAFQK